MAEEHDKTHRLVFSFARMIEDVIRLCLGGAWAERLDFSTLQEVPERLLSRELVRREEDVLWRVAYIQPPPVEAETTETPAPAGEARDPEAADAEPDWFYVYIHFEQFSSPEKLTALDMATYKLVAYQVLARKKAFTEDRKSRELRGLPPLPTILSVVFYTGERRWHAATSLLDLVEELPDAPAGLDLWSYHLIDARRYPLEELVGSDSPLLGLFRLEQLEDVAELSEISPELKAAIGDDEELAAAFVTLINEEILPRLAPPEGEPIRITDLEELPSMLAQRIDRITHRWQMEGWRKGRAEGEAKGRAEGEAKGRAEGEAKEAARLFLELFAAKFGDAPAQVRQRVTGASRRQLETWAKRLLRAERPEDVFED